MSSHSPTPAKLFFAYAREDEKYVSDLKRHLSGLERARRIEHWYDRKILAGDVWNREIETHLNQANLIVLLVSANFIASDYCHDVEFRRAEELHAQNLARIIPIIVAPVFLKHSPIAKYQCLPQDAKPLASWASLDAGFLNVVEGIDKVVDEWLGGVTDYSEPAPAVTAKTATKPRRATKRKSPRKRKLSIQEYRDKCGSVVLDVLYTLPDTTSFYLYPHIFEDDEVKAAAALGLPDGEGAVGVFVYTHLFILTRYMVFGDSGLFLECLDGPTAIPYWEFDERTFAMTPDGKLDLGFGEVPALDESGFDGALLLDILVSLKKAFKKSGWASQKPSGH